MAQDNRFDPARLERIERRLQALEDAEAIRNLKARYAALCDNQYDADGIAMLFTEDAVWESPALGRFEGREAIRGFFQGASGIFSFAIHYNLNGQIEVEGDIARARWYLFMPCTVAAGNQAMWRAGIDHETYARVDGTWMFRHKRSEPLMSVPFETGWARTRFRVTGLSTDRHGVGPCRPGARRSVPRLLFSRCRTRTLLFRSRLHDLSSPEDLGTA